MRIRVTLLMCVVFANTTAQKANLKIADSLYTTGNYAKAINVYAQLGSQKSSLQIARAYNSIGNYSKSIAQYKALVAMAPENQIARFELGKLYLKLKKHTLSKAVFKTLVVKGSFNPEYHYYYAETFRNLKILDSSVISYKNAVAIDSTHLRSLYQLGSYYIKERETYNAILYIDKGLRYYKDDVSLINIKALAFYNNREYEKAIPWFERVLELGEHKKYIYDKLGYSYFKNWEFNKAKQMFKASMDINAEDPQVYLNLASVYSKNKERDSAVFYVTESIKMQEPFLGKEYGFLAEVYREKEDFKSALKYYKIAAAESPKNPMYSYQVCTVADQYYKNSKVRLEYYEDFRAKFQNEESYFLTIVNKRISQLKEEIHYSKD